MTDAENMFSLLVYHYLILMIFFSFYLHFILTIILGLEHHINSELNWHRFTFGWGFDADDMMMVALND